MKDSVLAFKMALLAGNKTSIAFKTEEEAKVAFPKIVKDLENFVDSKDYLALCLKEWQNKKQ